jgi:hypothetical protein
VRVDVDDLVGHGAIIRPTGAPFYAGNGLWCYQEDLYNPKEGEAVMKRWLAAGGRFAS